MKTQCDYDSKKKSPEEKRTEAKTDVLKKDLIEKDAPKGKFEGTLRHKTGEKDK